MIPHVSDRKRNVIGVEDGAYEIDAVSWGYRTFQLVKDSVGEVRE